MSLLFDKYDSLLRLCFKVILLLFFFGLIITFFISLFQDNLRDQFTGLGISIAGITGTAWLFIKYDILIIASQNPNNLDKETVRTILKSSNRDDGKK
jgi:hypothetical protein